MVFRFHSYLTTIYISFGPPLLLIFDYILHYFSTTFCIIFGLSLDWSTVLIYFGLRFALFFRVYIAMVFRFYSFLTTFSIIFWSPSSFIYDYILHHFWLHYASFLDSFLHHISTKFCIIFRLHFALEYSFNSFWTTFCIIFMIHFVLFLEYILHWYSVFIHSWLHFALILDHRFYSLLTTFCITFGLLFTSYFDYILHSFRATFSIRVHFSFILDYNLHYF